MSFPFRDRRDAGRQLAAALRDEPLGDAVVMGLARGGAPVAAEVARLLSRPLDALAVRKVGHPWQPEYGLGAVTPGVDGAYVRSHDGLSERELGEAIARARSACAELDDRLHGHMAPVDPAGRTVVLVDDGLATGVTMTAAARWARRAGAARVVVAVPVGAAQTLRFLAHEADAVVCPHPVEDLGSVGGWYEDFAQVGTDEVVALISGQPEAHLPALRS